MDKLFMQLQICFELIEAGNEINISSLNKFCAAFHKFASKFKIHLTKIVPKKCELKGNTKIHVETIYLCFTQVITCITQLERTIKIESKLGVQIVTKRHFLDRINWCLKRFHASLYQLTEEAIDSNVVKLEDLSFVELLDLALDKLQSHIEIVAEPPNCGNDVQQQLYTEVNHIIKHALAFANVALESDKKALTTICETVLCECNLFKNNFDKQNPGDRKLDALSLQRVLFCLEGYLNEALLRLVFNCFLNVEESVKILKNTLQNSESDADKLITEFDINMDRIQQIGVFAIAFTSDVKTKTIVRSCLASLESLDACIVPAFQMQTSRPGSQHADILELHFNEEFMVFRNVIHEIIDSRALISCYVDMLYASIQNAEKSGANTSRRSSNSQAIDEFTRILSQVAQMGNVISQHFQLKVNFEEMDEHGHRIYEDFILILRECHAILEVAAHVEPRRIVKRLKILYSVLDKLRDALAIRFNQDSSSCNNESLAELSKSFKHSVCQRSLPKSKREYTTLHATSLLDNEFCIKTI